MSLLPYTIRIVPEVSDVWNKRYSALPVEQIQEDIASLAEYEDQMSPAAKSVYALAKPCAAEMSARQLTASEQYVLSLALSFLAEFREHLRNHQPGIAEDSNG